MEFVHRGEYSIELSPNESMKSMLKLSLSIGDAFSALDWTVLHADEKSAFIASDEPIALLPPKGHRPGGFYGTGLLTPGAVKIVRHALVLAPQIDPDLRRRGRVLRRVVEQVPEGAHLMSPFVEFVYGARFDRNTLRYVRDSPLLEVESTAFLKADTYLLIEGTRRSDGSQDGVARLDSDFRGAWPA